MASPPTPHALGEKDRLEWLDGLRAIAIVGVVTLHTAGLVKHKSEMLRILTDIGQYGVQLFFVISTITIAMTLRNAPPPLEWYTRRFFRIAPLYYLAITFYHPIFALEYAKGFRGSNGLSIGDIVANILFVHGWVPSANNTTVPGGWSIAVEMTFYLVAPLLVLVSNRLTPLKSLVLFTTLCSALVATSIFISDGGPKNNTFLYFWPINQIPIFLMGIGLYRYFGDRLYGDDVHVGALVLAAVILAAGLYFGTVGDRNHAFAPVLVALSGWAVIVGAGRGKTLLAWKPLAFVGRISFSIYIIHFFFEHAFRFAQTKINLPQDNVGGFAWFAFWFITLFSVSICAATFLYRYIELPAVRAGARLIASWKAKPPQAELPA